MVAEARTQPAAVAPLGKFRFVVVVVGGPSFVFFLPFDDDHLLPLELPAGARGLEDEGEGAAGGRGRRGGGLFVARVGREFDREGRGEQK